MKSLPKTYALLSITWHRLAGVFVFTILAGSISALPEPTPPAPKMVSGPLPGKNAKPVVVVATYSVVCAMESKDSADPIGKMRNLPIYSETDFQKFINRISDNSQSKDDPILKNPQIDFGKNMALILLNPNTLSSKPKVLSILEDATTIWVRARHPAKPATEKSLPGMGTYTVVTISFSGEVKTLRFYIEGE